MKRFQFVKSNKGISIIGQNTIHLKREEFVNVCVNHETESIDGFYDCDDVEEAIERIKELRFGVKMTNDIFDTNITAYDNYDAASIAFYSLKTDELLYIKMIAVCIVTQYVEIGS